MNNLTKILLIIAAVILILFLVFYRPKPQEGFESINVNLPKNIENDVCTDSLYNSKYGLNSDYNSIGEDDLIYNNKNTNYKKSNYSETIRGGDGPWDKYFNENNNIMDNEMNANNNFKPLDETGNDYAEFNHDKTMKQNKDCSPEELFDIDNYLPKEVNKDWFEVQPEPISVKNKKLINVIKPMSIDTVGTSKKGAGWDLRGTIPNPKKCVSPWNNSSIEPDDNIKTWC